MGPEMSREPDLVGEPELKAGEIQNVERLITGAQKRSRNIRDITVGLLLALIAFGAVLVFNNYQQHQKVKERQADAQRNKELAERTLQEQARLVQQVDNSRKASVYLTSAVNKARYQKQWKEALEDYDKALELDPDNPEALGLGGYLRFRMGDAESAVRMLRRAVDINPTNPWNHYNLALALWANGDKQDALVEVKKVLTLDHNFKSTIANDEQFRPFRTDREFTRLISE
jgi:tetratricopeptide (TPR) repeat protein